jgi:hypothetical protein
VFQPEGFRDAGAVGRIGARANWRHGAA